MTVITSFWCASNVPIAGLLCRRLALRGQFALLPTGLHFSAFHGPPRSSHCSALSQIAGVGHVQCSLAASLLIILCFSSNCAALKMSCMVENLHWIQTICAVPAPGLATIFADGSGWAPPLRELSGSKAPRENQ